MRLFALSSLIVAGVVAPAFASAGLYDVSIDSTAAYHHSAIFYTTGSGPMSFTGYRVLGAVAAGTHAFSIDTGSNDSLVRYMFVGASGTSDVTISLNDVGKTAAVGNAWEDVFHSTGSVSNPFETRVYHDLSDEFYNSGSVYTQTYDLIPFYQNPSVSGYWPLVGTGSLVQFSNGHEVGSVVVHAVPEPTSLIALGLGAVAFVRRRKG